MLSREDIQAISMMLNEQLAPIKERLGGMEERLDGMEERLDVIAEDGAITRAAVEQLAAWANDPAAQFGRVTLDKWAASKC